MKFKYAASFLILLLLSLSLPDTLFSQESPVATDEPEETDKKTDEEEVDRREEVLLYGIDNEVLTVLGDLQRDKINKYNELLISVFNETRNTDITQGIFRLWDDTSFAEGLPTARAELDKIVNDEDFDSLTVQAAIAYLANQEDMESTSQLLVLSDYRDSRIAASAVRALGKIGQIEDSASLETLLDKLKKEDPIAEEDLVAALIVTLGELRYEPASQEFVYIVEDAGASAGHRRLACISLGKIGRSEDFEIVETLYYETGDATLRSYALAGLAEFPDQDTTDILVQALKRDSFWRIRVTAAEKLSGNSDQGVITLLQYKALNDPINHVRIASLKSLGTYSDQDNFDFLLEYYKDKSKGTDVRLACLSILVENEIPGTNDAVSEVMDELWEKDSGRFLEFTCRDLSQSRWDDLAPVFERMLDHSNWLIQVYGIRGIRRNDIPGFDAAIEALDTDGVDGRVRREVTTGN